MRKSDSVLVVTSSWFGCLLLLTRSHEESFRVVPLSLQIGAPVSREARYYKAYKSLAANVEHAPSIAVALAL